MAIDNLLSVDIVTADGTLRTASASENEDLFWAVRGAGHNFGVVTSFEYRLHPVGPVLGGMVLHPIARVVEDLRFYREFTAAQPDDLQTWAGILTLPDGNVVVALILCYVGSLDEGERLVEPLRRFGSPVADPDETRADIPHGRLRPTDQNQALGDRRLGEIFFRKLMLALPYRTVDHGNAVRLGITANATAEPTGQPHQVGVFERLVRSGQRPPPHPKPARIMAHAEVCV
jgi:hypothetical protein